MQIPSFARREEVADLMQFHGSPDATRASPQWVLSIIQHWPELQNSREGGAEIIAQPHRAVGECGL